VEAHEQQQRLAVNTASDAPSGMIAPHARCFADASTRLRESGSLPSHDSPCTCGPTPCPPAGMPPPSRILSRSCATTLLSFRARVQRRAEQHPAVQAGEKAGWTGGEQRAPV
jgi:hypothetical protein